MFHALLYSTVQVGISDRALCRGEYTKFVFFHSILVAAGELGICHCSMKLCLSHHTFLFLCSWHWKSVLRDVVLYSHLWGWSWGYTVYYFVVHRMDWNIWRKVSIKFSPELLLLCIRLFFIDAVCTVTDVWWLSSPVKANSKPCTLAFLTLRAIMGTFTKSC